MAITRCPMKVLLQLLVQIGLSLTSEFSRSMKVAYDPAHVHDLEEFATRDVNVAISFPQNEFLANEINNFSLSIESYRPDVASSAGSSESLSRSDFMFDNQSSQYTAVTVITLKGNTLGKTGMKVKLVPASGWLEMDESAAKPLVSRQHEVDQPGILDVWVVRSKDSVKWTKCFVASVVILISLANVMMGCELDIDAVFETLKKPVAPAIGLFAQFFIMPTLAYIIAYAIFVPRGQYSMALGLFVTGCSPGGGASNFWTLLLGGNLNLSVTMTFISTLFSLVLMPTWLYFAGTPFLQGFSSNSTIKIPYGNITRSLASLVLPLLIGVAIKKWKPTWAAKARQVMRPFVVFVLVFVIVFGTMTNLYMFRMITVPALIGGLALPWCGFMFGCFTALITNRNPKDVTAIAVETGIQNTGIAILLLKASFGQPDSDIGSVIPVIVACFTPGPLLLGAAVHLTIKALRKRRAVEHDCEVGEKGKIPSGDIALIPTQNQLFLVDPTVKQRESEIPASA